MVAAARPPRFIVACKLALALGSNHAFSGGMVLHHLPMVTSLPAHSKETLFTLRDDNHQHYHRRVPIASSPLFVRLAWRATKASPVHAIGLFRLDLPILLREGYVRLEQPLDPDEVRVRFYRSDDQLIYVQVLADAPRLLVARAPL
jgi:hypothetical protein